VGPAALVRLAPLQAMLEGLSELGWFSGFEQSGVSFLNSRVFNTDSLVLAS